MTILEIIKKLNYLNNGASKKMSSYQWLQEIEKFEDLFCNHPEAGDTCTYKGNLVMKSDVTLEQLGYDKKWLNANGLK